jgi:nitrate/TMAO reductase-like tetraheme cytochrome c subunit
MMEKKQKRDTSLTKLSETLWRSFWLVFTLPFRTIWFGFKKLAEIPPKNLLLMAVIFFGLITVTGFIFLKATSKSGFCVTCHYMRPYYDSWAESTHNDIECIQCHFPPGIRGAVKGKFTAVAMLTNYMTGVYRKSKPWAEISDESCLREGCHQTRLLDGIVPYKEGILFDHTPHLTKLRRNKKLRCTSCHSQIVQGTHMTVTEETCFLCHFKDQPESAELRSCEQCHDAPAEADSLALIFDHTAMIERNVACQLCHGEMAKGDGDVPRERCGYCHAQAELLAQYHATDSLHRIHITENKVECNHCHNSILHQSIARSGAIVPDCQDCHADLHQAQFALFSGQGAVGIDPMPASMFHAGLSCKACHVLIPDGWEHHPSAATAKAGPASCESCHEQGYYTLYAQAKPVLQQRIRAAQTRVNSLQRSTSGAGADSVLQVAAGNIDLIQRAIPIHNLSYTDRILKEINRSLDVLQGKKPAARTLPDTTSARCLRCHYGQDEVTVRYQNRHFSHRNHIYTAGVGCTTCHLDEEPNHGIIRSGTYCMDCHHNAAAVSCEPCHQAQRNLYEAVGVFTDYDPDIMAEAGLTCRDCHIVEGRTVHRPNAASCEGCHEKGYWEFLQEMRSEVDRRLNQLESELKALPTDTALNQAINQLNALQMDGSSGGHNIVTAQNVLKDIDSTIKAGVPAESTGK